MKTPRKITPAIASAVVLGDVCRRIYLSFQGLEVFYVSGDPSLADDVSGKTHYVVRDATLRDRVALVVLLFQLLRILARERPGVVITTGAAPDLLR